MPRHVRVKRTIVSNYPPNAMPAPFHRCACYFTLIIENCVPYMIQEASISTRFSNNAEITLQIVMVLLQENSPAASLATTYDNIGIWDVIGL